jgi:hypothetical protein
MPALAFTDQRERLQRIVEKALAGTSYESSRNEDGRILVVEARRPDGRQVIVRFRGVRDSEASNAPVPGTEIRRLNVGPAEKFSLVRLFFPFIRGPGSGAARVRIEAGAARLDIVCEDAEWWEPDASDPTAGNMT